MLFFILQLFWLGLYWYYVEQTGNQQRGIGKRITVIVISLTILAACYVFGVAGVGWAVISIIYMLFDLFFDEESFARQWWRVLLPGALMMCIAFAVPDYVYVMNGLLLYVLFVLLAAHRGYLKAGSCIIMLLIYMLLSYAALLYAGHYVMLSGVMLLEFLIFYMAEGTLFSYKKGFEHQSEMFQREILGQQYEEIKSIYMNMRGWRHDYHNHLQVMKAQLSIGHIDETKGYLDELEKDLDKVDSYVKSGNLMVDAILNSKLSIAASKKISVNCKAVLPEKFSVEDVDMCVILGNLLDNAIEACEQIDEDKRFLRIYIIINKSQLYMSIQNSAKEELDFNEKNYITSKRGSHGFGMKRVKAVIDKYDGFLNLANEPGIFAAEVTMPVE